jgi:ATP-dependent DNA helicase RecG
MRRFQRGEIDVLVATTVIEVGVDVPNATVMVVEHAERFGLAQLHQLRGRVGRGAAKSYCILMTGERVSPHGEERLNAMVRTQDGFELAELDLTCAAPASSSARARPDCPIFAWPTWCATAVAGAGQDGSRPLCQRIRRGEEAGEANRGRTARVWARLKEAWQRRYGLVEAGSLSFRCMFPVLQFR